jgi:hypothetical protein
MNAAVSQADPAGADELADEDRDSLHTLPICILPVATPVFRRARVVKNSRLESVIEFFAAAGCGRGQMDVSGVSKFLGLEQSSQHPDVKLLKTVATLPSFDVYSLRILLRAKGIPVTDSSTLKLSSAKVAELSKYMTSFTRPLITEVFGNDTRVSDFKDIVGMFRNENADAVRLRLETLANRLGIPIEAIPRFLEDYADIFMSLSYYRCCLDKLLPQVQVFMDGIEMVRSNQQMTHDRGLMDVLRRMEGTINGKLSNITGKIESFERSTNDMWRDLTAERFRKIETAISRYHTSIGGALCALSVKMTAWTNQFPTPSGGVGRRAAFLMSDMRQGLEYLEGQEDDAPILAALNG